MSELRVRMLLAGVGQGPLIFSREPLSFWGGVDPQSGEVIDRRHPLSGETLTGKLLVFPGCRGSSSGSGVLLEAIRNRSAPAGIITLESDHILALAVMLGQELYGQSLPLAVGSAEFFDWAERHHGAVFRLTETGSLEAKNKRPVG